MRLRRASDEGIVQLLEAIVIGLILISVAFFALTFDKPSAAPSQARLDLQDESYQAIDSMVHTFYADHRYNNNLLSKAVAQALQEPDDPQLLRDYLEDFLPAGTAYNVYLSNGWDRIPVIYTREPTGQTAGASLSFEPHWRYVFSRPDLQAYAATSGATVSDITLGTIMVPVYDSNPAQDDGPVVSVAASGVQDFEPGALLGGSLGAPSVPFTVSTNTTTLSGLTTPSLTAVSLYMACGDGPPPYTPCYSADLTSLPRPMYWNDVSNDEWHMNITVYNAGPGTLTTAVGARPVIDVTFPVGITIETPKNGFGADWSIVSVSSGPSAPAHLRLELLTELGPASGVNLPFDVKWPVSDTRYPFATVYATMEEGTVSRSTFVWRVNAVPSSVYSGQDVRIVHASMPKPTGVANPVRWGVVVTSPLGMTAVQEVLFQSEDGIPVWVCDPTPPVVEYVSPAGAWAVTGPAGDEPWCTGAQFLAYTTEVNSDASGLFEIQLLVRGNNTDPRANLGSASAPDGVVVPSFENAYTDTGAWRRASRDVFVRYVPPYRTTGTALLGYPNTASAATVEEYDWETALPYRDTTLRGNWSYLAVPLTAAAQQRNLGARDAMAAGYVGASPYVVELGEQESFIVDINDLTRFVAENYGLSSFSAKTYVYPPWSLDSGKTDIVFDNTGDLGLADPDSQRIYDMEPFAGDGVEPQDVLIALGDGRVLALDGGAGVPLGGYTYTLPAASTGASATQLTRNVAPWNAGAQVVVGSNSFEWGVPGLDGGLTDPPAWAAVKPCSSSCDTYVVNNTRDLDGDGIPEVVGTWPFSLSPGNSVVQVLQGSDGQAMPGWGLGKPIGGDALRAGSADAGMFATPTPTIWSTTGLSVGVAPAGGASTRAPTCDPMHENCEDYFDEIRTFLGSSTNAEITFWVYGDGAQGWRLDTVDEWQVPGIAFTDMLEADVLPPGGDGWSEIYASDTKGNVYAFDAAKPLPAVDGVEVTNFGGPFTAIDMWDGREGFSVNDKGIVGHSRDGWNTATYKVYTSAAGHPLRDIDAVDGSSAWFVGDTGFVARTKDRLGYFEAPTSVVTLDSFFRLSNGDVTQLVQLPELLDLAKLDLTGVYGLTWDEAWITGRGKTGISDVEGKAYVLHTVDGGQTFAGHEFDCTEPDGSPIFCGMNGIEVRPDGRMYAIGDAGVILVHAATTMADRVELTTDKAITKLGSDGRPVLHADVTGDVTDRLVRVREVQVSWNDGNYNDLVWSESVTASKNGGAEVTLWDDPNPNTDPTYATGVTHVDYGVASGTTVNVTNYVAAHGTNASLPLGTADLYIGKFRDSSGTLLTASTMRAGTLTVKVRYWDNSEDTWTVSWGADPALVAAGPGQGRAEAYVDFVPVKTDTIKEISINLDRDTSDIPWLGYVKIDTDAGGGAQTPKRIWDNRSLTEIPPKTYASGIVGPYGADTAQPPATANTLQITPFLSNIGQGGRSDVTLGQTTRLYFGNLTTAAGYKWKPSDLPTGMMFVTVQYKTGATTQSFVFQWNGAVPSPTEGESGEWSMVQDVDPADKEYQIDYPCPAPSRDFCPNLYAIAFGEDTAGTESEDILGVVVGTEGTAWTMRQFDGDPIPDWDEPTLNYTGFTNTLRGVAFDPNEFRRAYAVGDGSSILVTPNTVDWTDLPVPETVLAAGSFPLYDIAIASDGAHQFHLVGGAADAILLEINGFAEHGDATTNDLTTVQPSLTGGSPFTTVKVDFDPGVVFESGTGQIVVEATRGDPTDPMTPWTPLKPAGPNDDPPGDPRGYSVLKVFIGDVPGGGDDLYLRISMDVQGSDRWTPAIRGMMQVSVCEETGGQCTAYDSPGWTRPSADIDTNTTDIATWFDSSTMTLWGGTVQRRASSTATAATDWTGELHLRPASIIWAAALDHDDDTAAVDIALAPTGPDPDVYRLIVATGLNALDVDNLGRSVYALEADTGAPAADWVVRTPNDPDPELAVGGIPMFVEGGYDRVYVLTARNDLIDDSSDALYVYQVGAPGDPGWAPNVAFSPAGLGDTPTAITLVDYDKDGYADVVWAVESDGSSPSEVGLNEGEFGQRVWAVSPTLPGLFQWNWPVPWNSAIGLYVVETRIRWDITNDLVPAGFNVIQTARLVTTFQVVPPGTRLSPSPAYSLEVISWLEHWG